jgi:hypothetical protein
MPSLNASISKAGRGGWPAAYISCEITRPEATSPRWHDRQLAAFVRGLRRSRIPSDSFSAEVRKRHAFSMCGSK